MNYNVWPAFCTIIILSVVSLIWDRVYVPHSKEEEVIKSNHGTTGKGEILNLLKPSVLLETLSVMCSILLCNTDDNISDALNHIRPSKCLNNLSEKINEQK